jgi:hypothetical protein
VNLQYFIFLLLALFFSITSNGQNAHEETTETEKVSKHRVSIMIGHTHVPKGVVSTGGGPLIIPSWGLNYSFLINEKWAIGWHNDMEISTYIVDGGHGSEIERERPFISSLVGVFKPGKTVGFLAGIGREFEKHQNFWVFRAGIELEFEINESWDISPSLIYDLKESVYDSWSIGLTVGRRL